MKKQKKLYAIFICIGTISSFFSCKNVNNTFGNNNGIEFDSLAVTKKSHLNNDTAQPFCEISIDFVYPKTAAKLDVKQLQQLFIENMFGHSYIHFSPQEAVDRYVANFIKNYLNDAKTFNKNVSDMKLIENLISPDSDTRGNTVGDTLSYAFYSYSETLTDTICYNKNNILSFQVRQTGNKGGGIPLESYKNCAINLKTGKILTENDIFKSGYEKQLRLLLIASLIDQNGVRTIDDLEDLGYFDVEEIVPNRNFLVDDAGITYIFNRGEYTAYPLNAQVVFLSYDALRPLLKENTVVSKLAAR
ncbi:MAG: RsiV family protein [Dysgonamonadaceae bacterium]